MTDVEEMLKRQAEWQKSRQHLTWPEKIRMAEQVRDSVVALRRSSPADRQEDSPGPSPLGGPGSVSDL